MTRHVMTRRSETTEESKKLRNASLKVHKIGDYKMYTSSRNNIDK